MSIVMFGALILLIVMGVPIAVALTGAALAALATAQFGFLPAAFWSVATSAVISAMTVSLKALGKGVAINQSKQIVEMIGKILAVFIRK